jgi:predicted dinucleotide-binding enzyme
MRIAVLGTGAVGKAVAAKLADLGHEVKMGTRDVEETMSRDEKDTFGNPAFPEWLRDHGDVEVVALGHAGVDIDLLINATKGAGSLAALEAVGEDNLAGKTVIDIANPLDFSQGMPPSLFVAQTDSLGEQIQRRFPGARVVKTLNTLNAQLMVEPKQLAGGDHTVFVSGNDSDAKAQVTELLESFGWSDIIDLGDITTARGTEMYLPLWVRIYALGSPMFNIKVVR